DRMAIHADPEPAETLKHLAASSESPSKEEKTAAAARAPKPWRDLVDFNPVGNAPFGIKDDKLHVRAKGRSRRHSLPYDDLLLQHHFAMVEHAGVLLGNAVPDIKLAQMFGHPAPALHVYENAQPVLVCAAARSFIQRSPKPPVDDSGHRQAIVPLITVHGVKQRRVVARLSRAFRIG